ncbi:MAG TPA: fibronectin type III-like domain-contianing protein, partial [Bacteroidales bacterium]|nr:fibronectin type III-like domain-contianing protein [Bacteroidales bacterium]
LSYTTFEYGSLKMPESFADSVQIAMEIRNTGSFDGEEVVQLYVEYPSSRIARPNRQLVGFERVMVPAGQERKVILTLKALDMAFWDVKKQRFAVEPGVVKVLVGSSSANIRLSRILEVK